MSSWPPHELAALETLTNAEFQDRYPHRSRDAIRHQRHRTLGQSETEQHQAIVQMHRQADRNLGMDKPLGTQTVVAEPDDEQYEALFRLFEDVGEAIAALSPTQDSTEFHAPDDGLPIGIVYTGDWHLGASGVDSTRLRADLQRIGQTEGLYPVGMGDYLEGVGIYNKAASALYGGLFNDGDLQEIAVLLRMRDAEGKWLAWVEGNHDAWMKRASGLSRMQRLAKQLGVNGQRPPHFCQGGGTIFAHVGNQRYVIAVTHNAKGNSQLNTSNAQRRTYDSWPQWENCDVIVCGHLHYNDLHIATRKGGRCVYLRSGTAKTKDGYAADNGFMPEYGIPLTILLPDEKRVIPFRGDDLVRGVEYLGWLRERYKEKAAG